MSNEFDVQYKQKLLDTFKVLIDFLEENKITYYAVGGTAIGAVRHHNIIPWDDDIDIFIPRAEYDRLIQLPLDAIPIGYEIQSIHNGGDCPYVKFVDINTSFWEIENLPRMSGIFIDIQPLDYFDGDSSLFGKKWSVLKFWVRLGFLSQYKFNIGYVTSRLYKKDKKVFISNLLSVFVPKCMWPIIRSKIVSLDKKYSLNKGSSTMACFYGAYGMKDYYDSEWFSDSIDCEFADIKIKLPIGYDPYLRRVFGDYMQLPPIEKRVYEHRHYYVNLKERVSIVDARKRVESGISIEW